MGMDDKRSPKKIRRVLLIAVLLLGMLGLYVAGSGPAFAMVVDGRISHGTYKIAYAPLRFVERRSRPVSVAMTRWRRFCMDELLFGD